ncbi:MAG: EAL domain-containing protein [Sulfurimonas sp.]|jgi:EAL and modified HD-GYP domain-containing signal transduction protein|nr:EAL domain-containing protein [Sulfurimonas sp.]MBU1217988.1 EAL domain-containing protein [bacterium]MBU1435211.1 EAL domain-containing protein [bacterium]MBU1502868.1 EAL domain-containing protein [bacterium]MBU3938034.1 EAL domain-containing protein [bacterium]
MNIINISKQKIFDSRNQVYAYELLFKDASNHPTNISSSLKGTAQLIASSITSKELDELLGTKTLAFVNVDEEAFLKGILDVLDKDRFILNILEDIELSEKVLAKIIQYRKRGFRLSLEHFDSSAKMIIKFKSLFNYIDIIKMDVLLSEPQNLEKVMAKFKDTRVKLLAQNIETKEDFQLYKDMGFDFFQGYYLDKPETIEIIGSKDPAQFIILQLIKIIKDNNSTGELESFIKRQPDLSYRLVEFLNNSKNFDVTIGSLTQVITLMGRDKLLRWLLVYLYSEATKNAASKTILELALKRAERMEGEASDKLKDKAYLAGMFSMLSSIFETNIKDLMAHIKMDSDISSLVLEKKGIFAASLMRAEQAEREYLKKIMMANFEKLNTTDLIYTLEDGGVDIQSDKF